MRGVSIAAGMGLVLMLAVDLALARQFLDPSPPSEGLLLLLLGLLPLFNVQLILAVRALSRFRVSVRRRPPGGRGPFGLALAVCCVPWSVGACVVAVLAYDLVIGLLEPAWNPIDRVFFSPGPHSAEDVPWAIAVSAFLGLTVSGPPLALAAVSAVILRRFRITLTPRAGAGRDSA